MELLGHLSLLRRRRHTRVRRHLHAIRLVHVGRDAQHVRVRLIRVGRLELDRLVVFVERAVHRERLEWFLLRHRRRGHRRRIALVLVAARMLSLRLRWLGVGAVRAARAVVALGVPHQIRFQLECFGADGAGERAIL